ncbi:malate:quinone oxidoreductase [Paenibacillus sp. FSL R7-0273]|uniref:malate:quinone oxidoreductase n=1 Tax=Paenibacillus sp. FSL R7-0273 TaxID=1536772 RepID=UPI0004F7FEB7|nr:malate:quinone oxidoreductase [Paenibacillus sp. FSL R7-0273]AIQ49996.1 malate:quinone oxidoreductase [Paenibacillus sp. FSL R7-0273]OMF90864.1 malate:quinone oxidoreductase [Paenibacillus sp. FSL R7-0273]
MSSVHKKTDVILIGAGVMSATLGALLKELAPDWNIKVFEKLAGAGEESSNEWNNAGTGHAALCELNYTSEKPDGSVDISKAVKINEQFQLSRQFWSYLVRHQLIRRPQDFIMPIPHMSWVEGEKNVAFLNKRFKALSQNPLFQGMEFSDDPKKLKEWLPLMMEGRSSSEPVAATRITSGTDVNFGALTRLLFDHLQSRKVEVHYRHAIKDIRRAADGGWNVKVHNLNSGRTESHSAKFVFIGAGGGSLALLQKTGIPESRHIGGFPVSGLFMVCDNPEVVERHHAKVYGKAKLGAPPMSVPHLDTRYINNKKALLFGPFAGFSPKFLKTGSNLDLIGSVKPNNLFTMLAAGAKEMALTKYLIQQLMLSNEQRMNELREFIPNAKTADWKIVVAGQRVQVIKDTPDGRGTLQFGTEVVSASDGSVAALLGASPGASTAVHVMLEVLEKCFPQHFKAWEPKIKEMIPSYGAPLASRPELLKEVLASDTKTLGLSEEKPQKQAHIR